MLNKELQVEIDVLHRQGKGIREIAREMGIARNTVRAILRGEHRGRYASREPRPTKLDPYAGYLRERLERAGKVQLHATVLLREIRALGYDGGITQLKEYLRSVRPTVEHEPIVRFETAPGKQLQIDFVVFRRGGMPLRAFTAELGFSRYACVEFTDNERTETLAACLERALHFFDGVPEQILCDNPKTVVIERNAYGEGKHRYNPYLLDVAKHYGIALKLCAPYRAQTKGKVERFHRYLRGSFFNPLQAGQSELVDVVQANQAVRPWLHEVANVRIHATLKERPADRYALERPALRALPLPYGGRRDPARDERRLIVPTPIESLQHPLATYDALAVELTHA
ncbi:MAG: IS21 family transposase [Vulcanimicrobiaceae bacterium]